MTKRGSRDHDSMTCAYCLRVRAYPDEFPIRIEAKCVRCFEKENRPPGPLDWLRVAFFWLALAAGLVALVVLIGYAAFPDWSD